VARLGITLERLKPIYDGASMGKEIILQGYDTTYVFVAPSSGGKFLIGVDHGPKIWLGSVAEERLWSFLDRRRKEQFQLQLHPT